MKLWQVSAAFVLALSTHVLVSCGSNGKRDGFDPPRRPSAPPPNLISAGHRRAGLLP